jgi:hypothetical protein
LLDLKSLAASDLPGLRDAFERHSLSNKAATAWALAFLGGESSLATLRKPLDQHRHGQTFKADDQEAFVSILRAIGYVGQKSPVASEYLLSMTRRDGWRHTTAWKVEQLRLPLEIKMPAVSLRAFAETGRPGLMKEIALFLQQFSDAELSEISGEVVGSVFTQWYIERYGIAALNEQVTFGGNRMEAFSLFAETPTGQLWRAWAREKEKAASK